MSLESILIKVSGDLIQNPDVLEEIRDLAVDRSTRVSIVYGFGTRLSNELTKRNIPFTYIDGIRKTNEEGLQIAHEVSEKVKSELNSKFSGYGNIILVSPVEKVDGKIVNTNSDEIVKQRKEEYNRIIIYTKEGRNKDNLKTEIPNTEIRYKP